MTQKTTDEIRELPSDAKVDFEPVENNALNHNLKNISQPSFTEDICTTKQRQRLGFQKNMQINKNSAHQ